MFNNKVILVTGATGSFGNQCVRYLLKKYNLKKIIIFSRDELKQYDMLNKLIQEGFDKKKLRFLLGDIRDKERLNLAFKDVDYVIHAAALKQIPAAEYNPQECINTNINGAHNIIMAALQQKVKKVIALSTDKACNPINLYGATKLASDKLFVSANNLDGKKETIFSVVRYGNVINSRGSVIPFFLNLVEQGKNVLPLTSEKMSRFFISLEEGVKFVIDSFYRMQGGEIFVPKLSTIFLKDLVKAFDCKYKVVGIRPGEKTHEVLCSREETHLTIEFKNHYVIKPSTWDWQASSVNYLKNKKKETGKYLKEEFEYASNTNKDILNIEKIKKIISSLK